MTCREPGFRRSVRAVRADDLDGNLDIDPDEITDVWGPWHLFRAVSVGRAGATEDQAAHA